MDRRAFLKGAAALSVAAVGCSPLALAASRDPSLFSQRRARPGDPSWPSEANWEELGRRVGGRLLRPASPLEACRAPSGDGSCAEVIANLRNPYFLGDEPALTQTSGWLDAWTSAPSTYAVRAASTEDIVAAVDFARDHNLRLVVRGGGHSYQGTSCSADSLLIWTRAMDGVELHDAFVPAGCDSDPPCPAVTVGAGALWGRVYDAVTTRAGRYVQGGGCTTVGVAGLVQSGGFGSFSRRYGLAAGGLLEAEVVTADGAVRTVNRCADPDLFWALRGGGGGSFGVVTRLTLATHALPEHFGGVFGSLQAGSDADFRRLVTEVVRFHAERLFNPGWGEQIRFHPDRSVSFQMVFEGLDQQEAEQVWRPLRAWVDQPSNGVTWTQPLAIVALPAQRMWDPSFLSQHIPQMVGFDRRDGKPLENWFWSGDAAEAGQFLHGYRSAWLPSSLLHQDRHEGLVDALVAASSEWSVSLHTNKGLGGASDEARAGAGETAMNPDVLDAFALAIIAGGGPPAFAGGARPVPDLQAARGRAGAIGRAMDALRAVAPFAGAYVSESDFFESDWPRSFWGENYERLRGVKSRYDPTGLFFVHHGVGSEEWSADGFSRLAPG